VERKTLTQSINQDSTVYYFKRYRWTAKLTVDSNECIEASRLAIIWKSLPVS